MEYLNEIRTSRPYDNKMIKSVYNWIDYLSLSVFYPV